MGDGWKVRLVSEVGRLWVGGRGRGGGEEEEDMRKMKRGRAIFFFYIEKYMEKEEQDEQNKNEFVYMHLHFENLIIIMAGEKSKIYSAKTHQFFPGNFACVFGQSSSGSY